MEYPEPDYLDPPGGHSDEPLKRDVERRLREAFDKGVVEFNQDVNRRIDDLTALMGAQRGKLNMLDQARSAVGLRLQSNETLLKKLIAARDHTK